MPRRQQARPVSDAERVVIFALFSRYCSELAAVRQILLLCCPDICVMERFSAICGGRSVVEGGSGSGLSAVAAANPSKTTLVRVVRQRALSTKNETTITN